MSDRVAYVTLDPEKTIGVSEFRCPHHRQHTWRFRPGIYGGELKSDCQCYAVSRPVMGNKILVMIIREEEGKQTPLRRFMERANGNSGCALWVEYEDKFGGTIAYCGLRGER